VGSRLGRSLALPELALGASVSPGDLATAKSSTTVVD
jgi:hypothetical protein